MSGIAALILCLAGFAGTALAKGPHHRAAFGEEPTPGRRRALRASGSLAFAAAVGITTLHFGVGYGLVVVAAQLNIAGLVVAGLLARGSGRTRRAVDSLPRR